MAIDMIENNELGALAPSRLGLKQFIDEGDVNYGGDEDFYNLFGSRNRKKENFQKDVRNKYINLPTDCENIQDSIDIIENDKKTLLGLKGDLRQKQSLAETSKVLGQFKSLQISQKCVKTLDAQKAEKDKKDTLDTLTSLSESSISKAQSELKGLDADIKGGTKGITTKQILIYGGVGVAALAIIALILKNR